MKLVEIKDLVKRYGNFTAVDHFSLDIEEGEILGLLGPNGSGKTTTLHCLLSLLNYNYGDVHIFGKKMHANALDIKKDIGIVPQNVAVFYELTVYENIDYFCGLYIRNAQERVRMVHEALEFVGLNDFQKHYPKELSGGLLRRLNIACGIAHKPKLIILDEPTVAVDPQSRNHILEGIQRLNAQGSTILYTTHYMEEVEKICSRIVIMDKGKEIASGTKEELKALSLQGEKIVIEVYNLDTNVLETLQSLDFIMSVNYSQTTLSIHCKHGDHNLMKILNIFKQEAVDYLSVANTIPTLNDVFLEITGKELRDAS